MTRGYGAPQLRTLLSIEYVPAFEKPDRDHDGIPDSEDACPDAPGVRDPDPKKNGCPPVKAPLDRDGDGIIDTEDACPDDAGPRTSDPRTNGCPDRDKDGIPDKLDACPDVPGVADPDPAKNGCATPRSRSISPTSMCGAAASTRRSRCRCRSSSATRRPAW